MSKPNIVARTLFHSNYVEDRRTGKNAVIVSEMVEFEDGTTKPSLRMIKDPNVTFWITQKSHQTHPDKKEFEKVDFLDEFNVPYIQKDNEICKALNGYVPNFLKNNQRRELYQSPYLYGGNITIEALTAMEYKKNLAKANKISHSPTTGFFDIEKSLLPGSEGALPLMVFTAEDKVFLAMKKSFMYADENGKSIPVTIEDVRRAAHELIDPLVASIFEEKKKDLKDYRNRLPFKYFFFEAETEIEMIDWVVSKMHETKVTFIGIWNLGFDIPEILKKIEEAGARPEDFFVDPRLRGTEYARVSYREDKRDVAHISQKWHWFSTVAHFQFIDSMALYSYIRQVDGKETSYKLDDILKKFGVGGKLKIARCAELEGLQEPDWHRAMLSRFFVEYALYAMWDGMALQILEWLNNDLTAMMLLGDTTPPKFFPNQTIRVTNTLFQEWKPKGYILGTGVDIEAVGDEDLLTAGGAVLQPQDLVAKGMRLFEEWPSHATHCYAWENDFDFSAQYPTNTMVLNISKQTKKATIFEITGDHVSKRYDPKTSVEVLCSYLITPDANGVELGTEFFNLPSFGEMEKLFVQNFGIRE